MNITRKSMKETYPDKMTKRSKIIRQFKTSVQDAWNKMEDEVEGRGALCTQYDAIMRLDLPYFTQNLSFSSPKINDFMQKKVKNSQGIWSEFSVKLAISIDREGRRVRSV